MKIELSNESTGSDIERELLHSLRGDLEQSRNEQFVLSARNDDEQLMGGLTAATSYGWLLIKTLWVHSDCRGQGIGTHLMQDAERRGKRLGCHAAWLDTSNPQAKDFYTRLGYSDFGQLRNEVHQFPANHKRWFLKKTL